MSLTEINMESIDAQRLHRERIEKQNGNAAGLETFFDGLEDLCGQGKFPIGCVKGDGSF